MGQSLRGEGYDRKKAAGDAGFSRLSERTGDYLDEMGHERSCAPSTFANLNKTPEKYKE
jgi:hypothetical protein